jgi:hypothetical protein
MKTQVYLKQNWKLEALTAVDRRKRRRIQKDHLGVGDELQHDIEAELEADAHFG